MKTITLLDDAIIREIPLIEDYPREGVKFVDLNKYYNRPDNHLYDVISELLIKPESNFLDEVEVVVGLESRGFILGSMLAYCLGLPFIPMRKFHKQPCSTHFHEYATEYSEDTFAVAEEDYANFSKALLVDDVLATGGTAIAAIKLLNAINVKVLASIFLLDIPQLEGALKLMEIEQVLANVS